MEDMITVTVEGNIEKYAINATYEAVAKRHQEACGNFITGVISNGKIKELGKRIKQAEEIRFVTRKDDIGNKTYRRTAIFLLVKAIYDIVGNDRVDKIKVEYSLGDGLFCSGSGDFTVDQELIEKVEARMWELVKAKIPIVKKSYPIEEAIGLFDRHNMKDKEKLFRYRRSSMVNVYNLDGFHDYFYGYMLPSADYVTDFKLRLYEQGFLLMLPNTKNPGVIGNEMPAGKLYDTLVKSNEWGIKMGVNTVGDLNDEICSGNFSEIVLVQEALQERRVAEIAKDIVARGGIKFVMIAGPSSSGKTTFSHRLCTQLRTLGLKPHPIAVDDYFVNREQTPRDENGDFNFEVMEAIDTEQFNLDMVELLSGSEVELPSFNFKKGIREYAGNIKKLGDDDILVIEGIHGLNDKMSYALPCDSKYKIYISALTTLNIDEHNRIPTTDGRLIRRLVRDARTRGTSAKRTIAMWPSVRKGEEENIFPYQESADAMFNSTLIYELAVLKQFAEPLLFGIGKEEPEYFEAKRLLKFFEYFLGVTSENLPNNSIIREFVGGSCFKV